MSKDPSCLSESTVNYPNVDFVRSTGAVNGDHCQKLVFLCQSILEDCSEDIKTSTGSLGSYLTSKYEEALQGPEYSDIDAETCSEVLEYFHKFENSIEASDSWFETSAKGYLEYWECEGYEI